MAELLNDDRSHRRRLRAHAADVVANHKRIEVRLMRAMAEVAHLEATARAALQEGDEAGALAVARRLVVAEREVESLAALHARATADAEAARTAVALLAS